MDGDNFSKLELAERELARELDRKASLEQRGITVITASGVFVTLVFAFVTVVEKGNYYKSFTYAEKNLLFTSLILFSLAALCGLITNFVSRYAVINVDILTETSTTEATSIEAMVMTVNSLRKLNTRKANWLHSAFMCQLLAIGTLSATVLTIIHP